MTTQRSVAKQRKTRETKPSNDTTQNKSKTKGKQNKTKREHKPNETKPPPDKNVTVTATVFPSFAATVISFPKIGQHVRNVDKRSSGYRSLQGPYRPVNRST